jgi:hypothetical protein
MNVVFLVRPTLGPRAREHRFIEPPEIPFSTPLSVHQLAWKLLPILEFRMAAAIGLFN